MSRLLVILLTVLVLVPAVILVVFSSHLTMNLADREVVYATPRPTATPIPGALTVEELVDACRARLDEIYPDAYSISLEGNDLIIRIVLSPETDNVCLEEANRGELSTWYPLAAALTEASNQWHRTFSVNGHPGIKVNLSYIRDGETGERRLATAVNGTLIYDFYEQVARQAAGMGGKP